MYVVIDYEETNRTYLVRGARTPLQAYKAYALMLKRKFPKDYPESIEVLYKRVRENEDLVVVRVEEI